MDLLDHALDAFLRWPLTQACLAGPRRIHPPECVPQEAELAFRHLADPCLPLVHRELQLAHDLAQSLQRRVGVALPAQDHQVGRKARTTEARDNRRGIPQGSPISPLLANLYMRLFVLGWKKLGLERRLDTRIVTYCK
jgi:hypothetical protein